MTTKEEAKEKLAKASRISDLALGEWRHAVKALDGSISVNGHGIPHDHYELRNKLLKAQEHIQMALSLMDDIEWPRSADYDAAE